MAAKRMRAGRAGDGGAVTWDHAGRAHAAAAAPAIDVFRNSRRLVFIPPRPVPRGGRNAAVSCARLRSSCTACASGLSTLCASGELARLGVDLDLLSFLDEQRHPDLEPGLECGRLRHAAA